jgi:serine/threonine-protein kinase
MDSERAERVAELLEKAMALEGDERSAFCQEVRRDDAELGAELDSLLAVHEAYPADLDTIAARVLPSALDALSRALATESPEQPRTVGRYRILERLGGGSMGEVYRASDVTLDRSVALKFLPRDQASDPEARARMTREAKAASALDHPNIAVIFEIGNTEPETDSGQGRLFIAMAWYGGDTVQQMIARGPLPVEQAVDLAVQTADGLAAAHAAGIVHRDIKPANLMVTKEGRLKILDFGVAKRAGVDVTTEGVTLGTIAYMSPEQTRSAAVDARTDIWSLGIVLYEMLAGVRPFPAEDGAVLLHAIRHDQPIPLRRLRPDIPEALEELVDRCLRKDPAQRFANAASLRDALRELEVVPAAVPPDRRKRRKEGVAWQWKGRRWRTILPALAVVGVATLASLQLSRAGDTIRVEPDDAKRIAVLPFVPIAADTGLARLGRDLAVGVAAALDGLDDLRTADAYVVLASGRTSVPVSREREIELAGNLGVGRLLQGTLTRSGNDVRIDARLVAIAEPGEEAVFSTGGHPHALDALTDSVTLALVRSLWRKRPVLSPILGATRTNSIAALRAYLDGERWLERSDMPRAVEAFERAFAIDTTYWFAYWRSLYPRQWYPARTADTMLVRRVLEHRNEFPLQERVLVESWMAERLTDRLQLLRDAVQRFDSYWPAWYAYGIQLLQRAPYLGTTREDARVALERTVELNPDFSSAWNRLGWIVTAQRDTAAMRRVLREHVRTSQGVEFLGVMPRHASAYTAFVRSGLPPADSLARIVDWLLTSEPLVMDFTNLAVAGGHAAIQLGLNEAILAREPGARVTSAIWRGNAMAWASRGAWDSALVAMDRAAQAWFEPRTSLDAYGLAVVGASLDMIPAQEAAGRRPAVTGQAPDWSGEQVAELFWLDGVLAHARRDHAGLDRARRALQESSATYAGALRGSLDAFATDAAGDRQRAARALARLEFDNADRFAAPSLDARYPFLVSVNRLHAAAWLRETGDDGEAARILTWPDAIGRSWPGALNVTFGWIGLVHRAEIAESMGQTDRARLYYSRFLERHDMPVAAFQPMINRARAGLDRVRPPD